MEGSCRMIDEFAKDNLHGRLRRDRKALFWKLDGLSEYDARRPLTATGTNLLGLVKHVATVEARYFGEVFDRPSPEPLSTPPAMCRGGRSLIRTRTCSPSWSMYSARPSGMPGTPTSCARASTAGPDCAPNTSSGSTRKPARPTARRSSRPPGRPHPPRLGRLA
ncbi:DUF664 domain-containing protein [Streptomyces syringium]|uniref:mycothiol transferase n=1 Tax=Streptomyces syringium TaxID=76729 RepID=UPI003AAB7B45